MTKIIWDLKRIYTYNEMKNLTDFINVNPFLLKNETKVLLFTSRSNGSKFENKNHGWVIVEGIINFDGWQKCCTILLGEKLKWEAPIGKEKYQQDLGFYLTGTEQKYVLEILK